MIEKTLKLTWRKALLVAVVYAALLAAHLVVSVLFRVDEQVLLLLAAIVVPLWAISAAVYSFDSLALWRGARWRRSA
jgi:fatty acid desaturase